MRVLLVKINVQGSIWPVLTGVKYFMIFEQEYIFKTVYFWIFSDNDVIMFIFVV